MFVQAEDGIRDLTVTGVQTCALPISAVVTDIAGKQLSPSLATWTSGTPGVATASSTGLVTGVRPGSAVVVATAAPGVADSLVVMVADPTVLPGNPLALTLTVDRSIYVAKTMHP